MPSLTLTSGEIQAAVERLEGVRLPTRTLASWAVTIAPPSVQFHGKRGRAHARLYSLSDLARIRLTCRLRASGISMPRVAAMFAYLERELADVFRPRTKAALVVDGLRAYVSVPGRASVEVPTGQLRLKLDEMFVGNERAAREAMRAA